MSDHGRPPLELDADAMRNLLAELDERMRARGIAASVYVVGGAAMALAYGRHDVTPDIDAVASHRAVLEEARAMAEAHGLAENWLNSAAEAWIPPMRERHDIRLLIEQLAMAQATPEHYADLLERVYSGEGRLASALGIPDSDEQATRREALAIGAWAHDFAAQLARRKEH